jgi:hypothetical protein
MTTLLAPHMSNGMMKLSLDARCTVRANDEGPDSFIEPSAVSWYLLPFGKDGHNQDAVLAPV